MSPVQRHGWHIARENRKWDDSDWDTHYFYMGMMTPLEAYSTHNRAAESNVVQYTRPAHQFAYATIVRKAVLIHSAYRHMCVVCLAVMHLQQISPQRSTQSFETRTFVAPQSRISSAPLHINLDTWACELVDDIDRDFSLHSFHTSVKH